MTNKHSLLITAWGGGRAQGDCSKREAASACVRLISSWIQKGCEGGNPLIGRYSDAVIRRRRCLEVTEFCESKVPGGATWNQRKNVSFSFKNSQIERGNSNRVSNGRGSSDQKNEGLDTERDLSL